MLQVNELYPIFLKTEQLEFLIVGGGNVALEKLEFLLKSSPNAKITMIAPFYREATLDFVSNRPNVKLIHRTFNSFFLKGKHVVIATTDKPVVNKRVHYFCKKKRILVNVADTPDLCDFYMGAIVTKGNLKIGISTNGKSPTLAKRIRQFLEELLPEEVNDLLDTLQNYRNTLNGDFEFKVNEMNKVTKSILEK
ncbi:bifunctional precorrin-2 dehydrogenase/sirohydrochlorin ferrochelatase [Flavobacteriaceae bacterium]|nr:bifunctional precorrin-2 dehydrogenase/sirohydrochlorin ferrochelatase [Flavobacteriaceae bacterium]